MLPEPFLLCSEEPQHCPQTGDSDSLRSHRPLWSTLQPAIVLLQVKTQDGTLSSSQYFTLGQLKGRMSPDIGSYVAFGILPLSCKCEN